MSYKLIFANSRVSHNYPPSMICATAYFDGWEIFDLKVQTAGLNEDEVFPLIPVCWVLHGGYFISEFLLNEHLRGKHIIPFSLRQLY